MRSNKKTKFIVIKMDLKNLIGVVALILLCSSTLATTNQSLFEWKNMTSVSLDKQIFADNEPITGIITFSNLEAYPALGTKIVLHLANGGHKYPSELNLSENIVEEKIINVDFVLPFYKKEINFSLINPGKGNFRVDAYVWVAKSNAVGFSNILYAPSSKNFSVTGIERDKVMINRSLTQFENRSGQKGFLIAPESKFNGVVVIDNKSSNTKSNLILGIKICELASAFCGNTTELKINVPEIEANNRKSVNVELTAPKIPFPYEISLVLYNGNLVESVYKNKVTVSGSSAKIKKIFLNGLNDQNYSLDIIIQGSSDIVQNSPGVFTFFDFEKFESKIELFNEEKLIEQKSIQIEKIKSQEVINQNYLIDAQYFTQLCTKIIKDNIVYEKECFEVDLEKLLIDYQIQNPIPILVTWTYDDFSKILLISLKKDKINAQITVIDSEQTFLREMVAAEGEYSKNIQTERKNLFLMVDDFESKTQQLIPINLALLSNDQIIYGDTNDPTANIINQKKCIEGIICKKNTVCSTKTELTIDGACCYTACVSAQVINDKVEVLPLIFWVALIVLIIAGLIVYGFNKRRKK